MALTKIPSNLITADAIDGTLIADDAINSEHIADGAIDAAHMSANSIDSDSYVDGSIDTAHIGDDQVTADKLANSINTSIAAKLPLAGGTLTGALVGTSSTMTGGFLGGSNGGIRIHSGGTKFFNITAANAARDNHMDIGASDARFKDLHISGSIVNSGDITIDSGANINLDADGGAVGLNDGGTHFASFENSSNSLYIETKISDKDILFRGNDGGSTITALTLDMSDAGTATFNHDIILGDNGVIVLGAGNDLQIWHDGSNSHISNNYGAFYIDQHQNDGNLILRCDDMSLSLIHI